MNFLQKSSFLTERLIRISIKIFSLKKSQLLIGAVVIAVLFALTLNSIQSFIWWGYWSSDLILIGTVDALIIAGVMAPILIVIIGQLTKYEEYKRKAEADLKMHAELSEEERKFKLYIENAVDVVTVIDAKAYITYESPSVKKNFGYDPFELIGKSAFEFIHPDDMKETLDVFKNAIKKPYSSNTLVLRFLRKDGTWAFVRVSGKNMIDDPIINGIILNVTDISERLVIENQLKKSIYEKEILMKEIHHRVKNNFMTISSLLYLQSEMSREPKVTEILTDCQNRVRSMALIHEKLYQTETFTEIDANSYIQRLVSFVQSSYISNSVEINIKLHVEEEIQLVPGKAISVGLIINELLSNIYKYAYPSANKGEVEIVLLKEKDEYCLTVKDDGIGLSEDFDVLNTTSLGLKLVQIMSEQMGGKFSIDRNNGTEFRIFFPL